MQVRTFFRRLVYGTTVSLNDHFRALNRRTVLMDNNISEIHRRLEKLEKKANTLEAEALHRTKADRLLLDMRSSPIAADAERALNIGKALCRKLHVVPEDVPARIELRSKQAGEGGGI